MRPRQIHQSRKLGVLERRFHACRVVLVLPRDMGVRQEGCSSPNIRVITVPSPHFRGDIFHVLIFRVVIHTAGMHLMHEMTVLRRRISMVDSVMKWIRVLP